MDINLLKDNDLLFTLKKEEHSVEKLRFIFENHNEIKFVSLAGYDLRGNATDAKIPVSIIIDDIENFPEACADEILLKGGADLMQEIRKVMNIQK